MCVAQGWEIYNPVNNTQYLPTAQVGCEGIGPVSTTYTFKVTMGNSILSEKSGISGPDTGGCYETFSAPDGGWTDGTATVSLYSQSDFKGSKTIVFFDPNGGPA